MESLECLPACENHKGKKPCQSAFCYSKCPRQPTLKGERFHFWLRVSVRDGSILLCLGLWWDSTSQWGGVTEQNCPLCDQEGKKRKGKRPCMVLRWLASVVLQICHWTPPLTVSALPWAPWGTQPLAQDLEGTLNTGTISGSNRPEDTLTVPDCRASPDLDMAAALPSFSPQRGYSTVSSTSLDHPLPLCSHLKIYYPFIVCIPFDQWRHQEAFICLPVEVAWVPR